MIPAIPAIEALPPSSTSTDGGPDADQAPAPRSSFTEDGAAPPPAIDDPYLIRPAPPERPRVSLLAVSALVAAPVGPVGAILAIVFGWHARREIELEAAATPLAPRRPGHGLATVGLVLGVVLTMAWGGALSAWAWTYRYRADPAGEEPGATPAAVPSALPHPAPPAGHGPQPPVPRTADTEPFAPRYTKLRREGGITVVDVGITAPNLPQELAKQRAEATTAGETLVVMTTANGCEPCRGVDCSLLDPLMQTALARVRLVRLDIDVFHEDLEALRLHHEGIPGFFLLAPDLTPRDGVTGGEWDDDIPVNIAPVLGAFVRGKYAQRREPWRAVPASGISL